jgi:hypothetical protein
MNDYFVADSVYNDQQFCRRFCMGTALFLLITAAVEQHDDFFQQCRGATGKYGLSALQKTTAALR